MKCLGPGFCFSCGDFINCPVVNCATSITTIGIKPKVSVQNTLEILYAFYVHAHKNTKKETQVANLTKCIVVKTKSPADGKNNSPVQL